MKYKRKTCFSLYFRAHIEGAVLSPVPSLPPKAAKLYHIFNKTKPMDDKTTSMLYLFLTGS